MGLPCTLGAIDVAEKSSPSNPSSFSRNKSGFSRWTLEAGARCLCASFTRHQTAQQCKCAPCKQHLKAVWRTEIVEDMERLTPWHALPAQFDSLEDQDVCPCSSLPC